MTLAEGGPSAAVFDQAGERWVPLAPFAAELGAAATDVLALLGADTELRERAARLAAAVEVPIEFDPTPQLPFEPRSLRAFFMYERHQIGAARGIVRHYFPAPVRGAILGFERLSGRTFPRLRPKRLFYEQPSFYMGNHMNVYADGDTVPWPSYSRELDFELELAWVVVRPLVDATPAEGERAIGGFVVVNDVSARDTQFREFRHGVAGPVVKSKTFANAMSTEVVTADELLPRIEGLTGTVSVNGKEWVRTSTGGLQHPLGAAVAAASAGEPIHPGELMTTGTLPGACGLELDRWIAPGDEVRLEIEGVATVTNQIGEAA